MPSIFVRSHRASNPRCLKNSQTHSGDLSRQLCALISLASKEHMKTKELKVKSEFWHAKCDELT
jgi:hypothetical protein